MSEEIKVITDRIKYIVDNPTYEDVYYEGVNRCVDENPNYTALDSKESKLLLDYITNLQQRVEQLENIRKEVIEYIENDLKKKNYFEFDENGAKYLLNILNKGSENNDS